MKISYNWLKNYIDTELPAETIADKLTLLGLEVENIEKIGSNFDGFLVGRVTKVDEHPSADRLRLCRVDLGSQEVQIVCGASNVHEGQYVPVATVGATLPVPMKDGSRLTIRKAKLRGEISEGMICSESELGIGENRDGIMVLSDVGEPGAPLNSLLRMEQDTLFEIALTPNRPDAACHIGVARDLAAVLNKTIHTPYDHSLPDDESNGDLGDRITLQIEKEEKCHRYVAKIVQDLTVESSPAWLQNRLRSIGLRPVNNVVDATNFVLHEIGQPLHAFDYDLLKDKTIVVRDFDQPQIFRTLDGQDRKVPADTLFICDGKRPVAIAGIMGGSNSEVSGSTKQILIESAWFAPSSIRKSAKKLAIQTDASYRFERGIDPRITRKACERAANLIAEIAGGTVLDGVADLHPVRTDPLNVSLRIDRLNRILGTELTDEKVIPILQSLEIDTEKSEKGTLRCTVPTFRPDITREVDLIEEVGRIFDYNNIPTPEKTPFFRPSPLNRWEQFHNRVKTVATRLMYKEITTNSLLSKKEESHFSDNEQQIETLNPVSQEATTLRSSLLSGFLKVVHYNLNRNAERLRLFEVGNTYRRSESGTWIKGIEEHSKLLLGLCGFRRMESWNEVREHVTIFDLKADLESFFQQIGISGQLESHMSDADTLSYRLEDQEIATLIRIPEAIAKGYDVHLPAFAAEVNLTMLQHSGLADATLRYEKVSRYPSFEYDVAYIIDHSVTAGELISRVRGAAGKILNHLRVFDVYEGGSLGEGKKSIAIRLTFLDSNKTLNINDVEPVVHKITQVLEADLGAKLRS